MGRSLPRLWIALCLVPLAGCSATGPGAAPDFVYSFSDRYPLSAGRAQAERIDVSAFRPGPGDQTRVARLARDFMRHGQGKIVIFVPQAGQGALSSGNWVRQELVAQDVSPNRIQWDARSLPPGIVRVAFAGAGARTAWDCTNLQEDVQQRESQTSYLNRETINFGCAYQSNLLAQADDPRDFIRARPEGPNDAVRAANAVRRARLATSPSSSGGATATPPATGGAAPQ